MNPLRDWRERFAGSATIAAAVCGVDVNTYAAIEAGEREPEPGLAVRLHIVTGGLVPVSGWDRVAAQLLDGGLRLEPVVTRLPGGTFGVSLFLAGEVIATYAPDDAVAFADAARDAAAMARTPPLPQPVLPWPGEQVAA